MESPDQQEEFKELELARKRALGLGFSLHGVHTSYAHWKSSQPGQSAPAPASSSTPFPESGFGQPVDDTGGVKYKWSWVQATGTSANVELVKVIEDSGSANNFISVDQIKKLGLQRRPMSPVVHHTLDGQRFVSRECVDVSWIGRETCGTDRFYIAPPGAPIDMLVGTNFINQHPRVFMEEMPKSLDTLLTVQTKIKKEEAAVIQATRLTMEAQAREIANKRRQRILREIMPPSSANSGASSSGHAALETAKLNQRKE